MQTSTRLAVLLAALVSALVLVTGCSSGSNSSEPLPDAATLLKDSEQTTRSQTGVHLDLTTSGNIQALPIEKLSGDLTSTPAVAAQGTADIVLLGSPIKDVAFTVVDGNLYAALTSGGKQDLIGPAADIYDVSAILSPDIGLANMLANFTDPKADSRENVNGVDAVKITGTVSAEAVNGIAPQLSASAPVPATVWIDPSGAHNLVQAKLEPGQDQFVQMSLSKWGESVTVTAPAP